MLYTVLKVVKNHCEKCELEKKEVVDKNCPNSSSCIECRCPCSFQVCGSICTNKSKLRCSLCDSHGHVSWWKSWMINKQ